MTNDQQQVRLKPSPINNNLFTFRTTDLYVNAAIAKFELAKPISNNKEDKLSLLKTANDFLYTGYQGRMFSDLDNELAIL